MIFNVLINRARRHKRDSGTTVRLSGHRKYIGLVSKNSQALPCIPVNPLHKQYLPVALHFSKQRFFVLCALTCTKAYFHDCVFTQTEITQSLLRRRWHLFNLPPFFPFSSNFTHSSLLTIYYSINMTLHRNCIKTSVLLTNSLLLPYFKGSYAPFLKVSEFKVVTKISFLSVISSISLPSLVIH